MPTQRLSMRRIKQLLTMRFGAGASTREIARELPWGDVVRVLNWDNAGHWTVERLRRTVRRLASEGIVQDTLLDRARPQPGDDCVIRCMAIVLASLGFGSM